VGLEEGLDGGDQIGHAGKDAAAHRLIGELAKPALDEVQPSRRSGAVKPFWRQRTSVRGAARTLASSDDLGRAG
jgi:hypothetical protein